jgi:hypothetical protein
MWQQELGNVGVSAASSPPYEVSAKKAIGRGDRIMGDEKLNDAQVPIRGRSKQGGWPTPILTQRVDERVRQKMTDHISTPKSGRQEECWATKLVSLIRVATRSGFQLLKDVEVASLSSGKSGCLALVVGHRGIGAHLHEQLDYR